MSWRDIKFADVHFDRYERLGRALHAVRHMARPGRTSWPEETLGAIAAMGERKWLRASNIGPKGVEIIKAILDDAAAGIDVTRYDEKAGYLPRTQRPPEPPPRPGPGPALVLPITLPAPAVTALHAIACQRAGMPAETLSRPVGDLLDDLIGQCRRARACEATDIQKIPRMQQLAGIGAVAVCMLERIEAGG